MDRTSVTYILCIVASLMLLLLLGTFAMVFNEDLQRFWHFVRFFLWPPQPVLPPP